MMNTEKWAKSWAMSNEDLEPGQRLIDEIFIPFIQNLNQSTLSKKTIERHTQNIYVLGGELIRMFYSDESQRELSVHELVAEHVFGGEGPMLWGSYPESIRSTFDSTCKKLEKYLLQEKMGAGDLKKSAKKKKSSH